jgi:hypothetical protein
LNKYLYENSDNDKKNDVEDVLTEQEPVYSITTIANDPHTIEIDQSKISNDSRYLNRVFVLGNLLHEIYHADTLGIDASIISKNNKLKLSNFIFYLYQLYKLNIESVCHEYYNIKEKFFTVLKSKDRAKSFFHWFGYYNKHIFIEVVKNLCIVIPSTDFNMDYLNAGDDLDNNTDNPLSQENQEATIERENQNCATENSVEELIKYLTKSPKGFQKRLGSFILYLCVVYNTYDNAGIHIVKKHIGDIYEVKSNNISTNTSITIHNDNT